VGLTKAALLGSIALKDKARDTKQEEVSPILQFGVWKKQHKSAPAGLETLVHWGSQTWISSSYQQ
jgi:hypothetical protein